MAGWKKRELKKNFQTGNCFRWWWQSTKRFFPYRCLYIYSTVVFFSIFFFFSHFSTHYWMLACGISCVPFFPFFLSLSLRLHPTKERRARHDRFNHELFFLSFFLVQPHTAHHHSFSLLFSILFSFRTDGEWLSECAAIRPQSVSYATLTTGDQIFFFLLRCRRCCWIVFVFSFPKSSTCDRGRLTSQENLIEIIKREEG